MGLVKNVIIAILTLSLVVFCALFGSLPGLRRTPIGFINRLIWIKIPSSLISLDRAVTGGRSASFLKRSGNYLMNANHPLVLIFYLAVVFAAQCTFLPAAWPRLTLTQRFLTVPLCILPFYFTLTCAFSTAQHVTPASHERHMRQYPYDHVLFHPGQWCATCAQLKPPRSKHCRVCDVCVAKQDHHCIWVRTCLGRGNYHLFLLMLASMGSMLVYGAYLAHVILGKFIQAHFLERNPSAPRDVWWSEGRTWALCWRWWTWAFANDVRVGCVGLLAGFTAPLAWGLFAYHMYLIWAGTTTNESFKWEEWKEDVADGYVWMREADEGARNEVPVTEAGSSGAVQGEIEPEVDWPASTRQRLVSRANKMSMERELKPGLMLDQGAWSPVKDMADIVNLYDLGFWDNLKDVFRTY